METSLKILAVIQARMGSTRFPGKSMADLLGRPILDHMFDQLGFCRYLDGVVLATTDAPLDDPLAEHARRRGWNVFRGHPTDVLGRYYHAAQALGADRDTGIVRLTGDDILPDPCLVDAVAAIFHALGGAVDHVATDRAERFPYGAGVELVSFRALEAAFREATDPSDREHVTPFVRRHGDRFPFVEIRPSLDWGKVSLSIDYPDDLARNQALIRTMSAGTRPPFHLRDILAAWPQAVAATDSSRKEQE